MLRALLFAAAALPSVAFGAEEANMSVLEAVSSYNASISTLNELEASHPCQLQSRFPAPLNPGNPAPPAKGPQPKPRSPIPAFNLPPGFPIEMRANFPRIGRKQAGKIRYQLDNGQTEEIDVTFEPRGAYRQEHCKGFPPFKIELSKGAKGTLFKGSDRDLKFVTHCNSSTEAAHEKVRQEHAIYRMIEAAGLRGYLTQLVKVTYRDKRGKVVAVAPGFFIENHKDVAKRVFGEGAGGKPKRAENPGEFLIAERLARNTDFSQPRAVGPSHNARRLASADRKRVADVAYDFDLSDLVDGGWAGVTGSDENELRSIVEDHGAEARGALRKVISRERQMHEAVRSIPLSPRSRERFVNRIREFVKAAREAVAR